MNIEQLCCLHEAIKNRMPIPRNTLIKTVEKAFEIEGWTPQNKHGFSIIEETPSSPEEFDCLPLTYSIQTQRWNSLSNGQLGAIDDEIFEIQEIYNKNVKSNPELVEKVINSLFEARIDAMLPTAIAEIQKEYGTAHELVDALLHMNPRQMDYLKSISEEHDKMDEFKEGLWVLDEILEYPWSPNETDELLFAVQNQINPEPRNSLSNTVSKKQEPEYHSDKDCSFRTFSFVSVLCLKLFNKENESHLKLKRKILHIGYRLSFTNEWDPLMHVEHQPVIPEIMLEYQKSNESVLFVRDSLILAVIKGRAIQKLGLSKIEEYFNILIDSEDHEQAVRQSLEFNRDNIILRGDLRINTLRKYSEEATSPFMKGLIDYLLANKLPSSSSERIERLTSALEAFSGVDVHRFNSAIVALIMGRVDENDPDSDNPVSTVPQESTDSLIVRLASIVNQLNQKDEISKHTKIAILHDINFYLGACISNHRMRCNNCDDAHLYIQKKEMVTNEKQVLDLEESLAEILTSSIQEGNEEFQDVILEILERCKIIKVVVLNISKLEIKDDVEPYLHSSSTSIARDINEPIKIFTERYKFEETPSAEILEKFGSFLLHLSEEYIGHNNQKKILTIMQQKISDLHANSMNDIDSTLYHFVNGIISDCLLQSPNNWLQIFREESKQKMEDLISEGEDRTQAEAMLGLVMISTQGLLAPGLGIYKWPHELFCLISQFSQDSIGDLERLDNADTSYYELVLSVSQVSIQGVESAIDHLESNPENSSLDFEPSTAIEQLNSSKEIFDKIRLELDEYFGAS